MHLDKIKSVTMILKKNCFLPLAAFMFSFINIISCFVSPTNHSSLYELIANDIGGAKNFKNTGLVKIELDKVDKDYNYLYGVRYYFDRIDSLNRKGKSYVTYDNYETVFEFGSLDSKNIDINYSIGIIDASSFSRLCLTINDGEIDPNNYSTETKANRCVISEDYFYDIKGESSITKKDVIGKKVKYLDVDFIIDAIVDNSSFVSTQINSTNNKFIAFRYGRITSKTVSYKAHMFFNKGSYYDNYASLIDFFGYIYNNNGISHLDLFFPENEWIISDVENFRILNGDSDKAVANKTTFIINFLMSLIVGAIVGAISLKTFKSFATSKKSFYTLVFAVFAYFIGLFVFGFAFNRLPLSGIHINTFTGYGSLFAVLYSIIFFFPIFVCSLFGDELETKELKDKPLVSIIIPVYNGDNYLASSMFSALNQSYENIELIVVNDGSTDNGLTEKIATSFVDKRIRYFSKQNGGVASALNYGIDKASGDYICWLSHDDVLPKDKILYQLLQLQEWGNKDKIIPYSDNFIINEGGFKSKKMTQYLLRVKKTGAEQPADYFKLRHLIFGSLLVPKDAFKENRFVVELLYSQDTFMFFQFLKSGFKLRYSKYGYIKYRVHSSQGSFTRNNQIARDAFSQYKFFTEYYDETKDSKFIINCLMFYAKRAGGFDCYKELFQQLLKDKEKYNFSRIVIYRAITRKKVSTVLYNLKKRVLGR